MTDRQHTRKTVVIVATIVVVAAVLSGFAYVVLTRLMAAPGKAAEQAADALTEIAAAFKQGTVRIRFSSYAAEISGSQYLQFATLDEMEIFERVDSSSAFWGALPLPDVVVEARAPVQYTYYVDLGGDWRFVLENDIIAVSAPPIEFNAPAVDASAIEYRVREDSLLRDSDEAIESLQVLISGLAEERARDNVELVREVGRRRIEEFVRSWLGNEFEDTERLATNPRSRGARAFAGRRDLARLELFLDRPSS
jgi:hypothetical protein